MAATWLTELLLDTLNRALLQQGGADEPASSGGGADGAEAEGEGGSAYQQVHRPGCSACRAVEGRLQQRVHV